MILFPPDFLSTVYSIPNSCVYALINDLNMTCSVMHSNNLQSRLGAIIEANGIGCRLVVLDVLEDLEHKLLLCERYKLQYMELGYSIIVKRKYINYKVSIQYNKRFHKVNVVLYNSRRDKKIVGVFDNINEAKEFVDQYYKQDVLFPVYSTNKGTKEMVEREKRGNKNTRIQI